MEEIWTKKAEAEEMKAEVEEMKVESEKKEVQTEEMTVDDITMKDIKRLKWYEIEKKLLRWIIKNRRAWDIICGIETGSVEELDQIIEELDQGGFIELEYAMMCRKDSLEDSICEK